MKIPCSIILDLLPAYVDGLCSGESSALVEEHLSKCDRCREAFKSLQEPLAVDEIEKKVNFDSANALRKIKWNYITRTVIVVFLALFIVFSPFIADQIDPIRNFLHPSQSAIIYIEDNDSSWKELPLEEGCLIFDSQFYEKRVINHANSHNSITIRIKDSDNNIVVPEFSLNPGQFKELPLKSNQKYYVEVQANQGSYIVVFI